MMPKTVAQINPNNSKEALSPQQIFYNEYQALCDKHGMRLNVVPAYKPDGDGGWTTVLHVSVVSQPEA